MVSNKYEKKMTIYTDLSDKLWDNEVQLKLR